MFLVVAIVLVALVSPVPAFFFNFGGGGRSQKMLCFKGTFSRERFVKIGGMP
jgi:hypothetical protein